MITSSQHSSFPPIVFPYKSILPQTQPEKAAVQVSFVHEARLNRNDYRTKKVQYSEKLVLRQKKKTIPTAGAYSDLFPAVS